MQGARGLAQERVQHVLPRLHERRALLPVPLLPPRPPRHPDTEVVVPRRDPGVGDTEGAGHRRRADVHHQQRPRGVPQRAPPAQARQGRHQHLPGLRPQPPRHLPLLLPRLQDRRHIRRLPRQEEARHRQEEEAAEGQRAVGLGGFLHDDQRRERQEQRGAELHPVDASGDDGQQLPHRQAAQGRPAPVAVRQPHGRALEQSRKQSNAGLRRNSGTTTVAYTSKSISISIVIILVVVYIASQKELSNNKIPHCTPVLLDEEAGAMQCGTVTS